MISDCNLFNGRYNRSREELCMRLMWLAVLAVLLAQSQETRVGTFHKGAIVVAFYRSPLWSEVLKGKMAEMQKAKAAGDAAKVEELERWGKGQQEKAHQQLAGSAGIDEILDAMKPGLVEVAKEVGVSRIVAAPVDGASVDVTGKLLDWLKADERTRAIVKDLPK